MSGNTPFSDVFRLDPGKDIPLAEPITNVKKSLTQGELQDLAGSITELGLNGVAMVADPLGWLIGAGLGFLVDVVQPLEDLLGLVTGNGERLGTDADRWSAAGQDLGKLADDLAKAIREELSQWSGTASDKARKRLNEFAEGVGLVAGEISNLKMFLDVSKLLMDTAQAVVLGIITEFVEWLVITWLTAQALAPATFGASEAGAAAATTAEGAVAVSRATRIINKVREIMQRLMQLLSRIRQSISRARVAFANSAPGGMLINRAKKNIEYVEGLPLSPLRHAGKIAVDTSADAGRKAGAWALDQHEKVPQMLWNDVSPREGKGIRELLNPDTSVGDGP